MSRIIRICPGVGDSKCDVFLSFVDRDTHPTCTRCRGNVCASDMICDICAVGSATQWEQIVRRELTKIVRSLLALQALFLLRRRLPHARKLLREFRVLGLLLLLLPSP